MKYLNPFNLNLGFIFSLLILAVIAGMSYQTTQRLVENTDALGQSVEILSLVQSVLNNVANAQAEAHAYDVTGNQSYANRVDPLLTKAAKELNRLRELSVSNNLYLRMIYEARQLLERRDQQIRRKMAIRDSLGLAAAERLQPISMGDLERQELQSLLRTIEKLENEALVERRAESRQRAQQTIFALLEGTGISVIVLIIVFVSLRSEIQRRQKAETSLKESETKYREIVESATDIIYRADESGRFTYANPVALRILGYIEQELIGRRYLELIPAYYRAQTLRFYLEQRASMKESSYFEFPTIARDGREIWLGQNVQLLREEGRIVGWQAVARDITERKRVEEELRHAKEAAESATKAKSEFLAMMSHEIRTPMNGVIGMTDLLWRTPLNEEQRDYVNTIRTSGESLLTIINDILDFSKIESHRLDLDHQPFSVQQCIDDCFDLLAPKATEKNLELLSLVESDIPTLVIGDAVRLRQILVNLISNAIKFTPRGEVFVHVDNQRASSGANMLHFSIRDTGIGIPPLKVERLFKAFSQVDSSLTRKFGGTGLGLAISSRLTELMGGRLWVESTEGIGSIFHFTVRLPARLVSDESERAAPTSKVPNEPFDAQVFPLLANKRVLLVHQNATSLKVLASYCQRWSMPARATSSQEQALEWIRSNEEFDVALLDASMPGVGGIELGSRIRSLRSGSKMRVALVISPAQEELKKSYASLFDAFISTPLKSGDVRKSFVQMLKKEDASEAPTSSAVDHAGAGRPLRILVAEDDYTNQRLMERMLNQLGHSVQIVTSGEAAQKEVRSHSYNVLFVDIHLPGLDGLSVAELIHQELGEARRPKLIVMSADMTDADRAAYVRPGVDDVLSKPIRLEEVQRKLELVVRQQHSLAG
ncbi:MAG: response regulator [Ignavibacteriales bacterium]|nr:response regulator [Ignavibacteriales bacterium]